MLSCALRNLLALASLSCAAGDPLVKLDCGTEVRGYNVKPGVEAFEGIRYAEPPLRWSAPQDAACDGHVIDAMTPGNMCAQHAQPGMNLPFSAAYLQLAVYILPAFACIFGLCAVRAVCTFDNAEYANLERPSKRRAWISPRVLCCSFAALLPALCLLALPGWVWSGMIGDEDCLFLNVYRPTTKAGQSVPTSEPLAVMVWIHGGALEAGSSRLDDLGYGSSLEMVEAGVVHVQMNYRLGAFGFLYLDDEGAVANLGVHDQIAALRWVRKHIRNFGGDPDRVLVYGHSAGGVSVATLQRMPAARGLFHAAAAMSPIARIGAPPAQAAAVWREIVRPTGCTDRPCLLGLKASSLATLLFPVSANFGVVPDPLAGILNERPDLCTREEGRGVSTRSAQGCSIRSC